MDASYTNVLKGTRQYFQGLPSASNADMLNPFPAPSVYTNATSTATTNSNERPPDNRKPTNGQFYQSRTSEPSTGSSNTFWPSPNSNSNSNSTTAVHQHPQYSSTNNKYQYNYQNHHYNAATTTNPNPLYNLQKATFAESIAATPVTVPHPKHTSPVTYHELQSRKPFVHQQPLPQMQNQQQIDQYPYQNSTAARLFYSQNFQGQQFPSSSQQQPQPQQQADFPTQQQLQKTSLLAQQQPQQQQQQQQQRGQSSNVGYSANMPPYRGQQSQSQNFHSNNSYQTTYQQNRDYLPTTKSPKVPTNYMQQYHQQQQPSTGPSGTASTSVQHHLGSSGPMQRQPVELTKQTKTKINKRESPLDLSVKTVKTTADSTASFDDTDSCNLSPSVTPGATHPYYTSSAPVSLSCTTTNTVPSSSKMKNSNIVKTSPQIVFNKYQQLFQQQQQQQQQNSLQTSDSLKSTNIGEWLLSQQQHFQQKQRFQQQEQVRKQQLYLQQQQRKMLLDQGQNNVSTVPKKRPLEPVTGASNKVAKMENWLQAIDQQIEQKFSSYTKAQGQSQTRTQTQTQTQTQQLAASTEKNGAALQTTNKPNYYENQTQGHQQMQIHGQMSANIPSHLYDSVFTDKTANEHRDKSKASSKTQIENGGCSSSGAINKKVLNLLRNSLESKEAHKKSDQMQRNTNQMDANYFQQQPMFDVTTPKSSLGRHNLSPFTASSLLFDRNNSPIMNKSQTAAQIQPSNCNQLDSAYFDPVDLPDKKLLNQFYEQSGFSKASLPNGATDLDGLAAFLAARIRTKAELKQLGPLQNNQTHQSQSHNQQYQPPTKITKSPSVKKRRLSNEDVHLKQPNPATVAIPGPLPAIPIHPNINPELAKMLIPMKKRARSGVRTSSETSIFDFHESDSENDTHSLEKGTLNVLRKDRKKVSPSASTSISGPSSSSSSQFNSLNLMQEEFFRKMQQQVLFEQSVQQHQYRKQHQLPTNQIDTKLMAIENKFTDHALDSVCNKFVQKLKSGGGKKRGRRKQDQKEGQEQQHQQLQQPDEQQLHQQQNQQLSDEKKDTFDSTQPHPKSGEDAVETVPLGSNLAVKNDIEKCNKNPLDKEIIYYPGWETELYNYKKSLRMPVQLINIKRPSHWPNISLSLPDLDPYPSSPCSSLSVTTENQLEITNGSDKNDDHEHSTPTQLIKKHNSIIETLAERYGKLKESNKFDLNSTKLKTIKKSIKIVKNLPEILPTPLIRNYNESYPRRAAQRLDNLSVITNSDYCSTNISKMVLSPDSSTLQNSASFHGIFGDNRPASAPPFLSLDNKKKFKKVSLANNKSEIIDALKSRKKKVFDEPSKKTLKFDYLRSKKFLYFYSLLTKKDRCVDESCDKNTNPTTALSLLTDNEDVTQNDDHKIQTTDIDKDKDKDISNQTDNVNDNDKSILKIAKKGKLKRKLSSGFDHGRKKKKPGANISKSSSESTKTKNRKKISNSSFCANDISKEIKGWVLNKGVGETYLHRASRLGHTDVVAYCLEKMDMNPSVKDNAGYTPLHEACAKGFLDVAKLLLMYGANVSEAAQGGIRPLHEAAENGFVEIIRLLLSYGADMFLATYSGQTPLTLATEESTISLLKNHLFDIQGQPAPCWQFNGPSSCFDSEITGYDILHSAPMSLDIKTTTDNDIGLEIEISDQPLPNTYCFKTGDNNEKWMILNDLLETLKMKTKDGLLKQLNTFKSQSDCDKVITDDDIFCEIKFQDFLDNVQCNQLFGGAEKLNIKSPKIVLVKCTEEIDQLLCIETFFIPDR